MSEQAAVVLLHPLALRGELWQPQAQALADEFTVFTPDLRGHGDNPWDGAEFTVEDLAEDVRHALDDRGVSRAHVVGMSMGGSVAMTFAARHPDRVATLTLADTTAWYGEQASVTWADRAVKAETVPRDKQVTFQVDRWFSESFVVDHYAQVKRVVDLFVATDGKAHAAACRMFGRMDVRDLLPAITAPTLVLVGEQDYATPPAMARALADRIGDAALLVVPGARHMALIERPELLDTVRAQLRGQR